MGTCCTVSSNVLVEMLVDDMSLLHDVLNECGIIIFFIFLVKRYFLIAISTKKAITQESNQSLGIQNAWEILLL
jgi:hypothetical protein